MGSAASSTPNNCSNNSCAKNTSEQPQTVSDTKMTTAMPKKSSNPSNSERTRHLNSNNSTMASGMAFVQAPGGGWFVLKDAEQDHPLGRGGSTRVWEMLLGVDEQGVALAEAQVELMHPDFVEI